MEHGIVDYPAIFQVLDDNPLQKLGRYSRVPDTLWINDDDRSIRADAEAGRLPAFYAVRPKEKTFPLEQPGQSRIQSAAAAFR